MKPTVADLLAQYTCNLQFSEIPGDVATLAKLAMRDGIGCAISAANEPLIQMLFDEAAEAGGAPQCSVIGRNELLPHCSAALVNGTAVQAFDFDDVSMVFSGHPTAVLLPVVLALGELEGRSGKEVLTAYLCGYEVACSISRLILPSSQNRGFHMTGVVGTLGAAAAAARLHGLSPSQTAHALGIAASHASGLRIDGGTMCKPLHAGRAASNGIFAARMALRGFTARIDFLETQRGFVEAYSDEKRCGVFRPNGTDYYLRQHIFKRHAACFYTHSAIECARFLGSSMREHNSPRPLHIEIEVNPSAQLACGFLRPEDELEAKRSFPLGVALAFDNADTADQGNFRKVENSDRRLLDLLDIIHLTSADDLAETAARVMITYADGSKDSHYCDVAVSPTTRDASEQYSLDRKFENLVTPVLGSGNTTDLSESVLHLEQQLDMRHLAKKWQVPERI